MIKDEEKIASAVASGDREAFRTLYECTVRSLGTVCSRYISEAEDVHDVLQESYIDIFRNIGRFRWKGEGSLRAWMTRIVVNKSVDFLREQSKTQNVELTDNITADIPDEPQPDADDIPLDTIVQMIRELPAGYRTVFNMFAVEHMPHKEIAQRLGITEKTSASQLHRAKALLAAKINKYRKENSRMART